MYNSADQKQLPQDYKGGSAPCGVTLIAVNMHASAHPQRKQVAEKVAKAASADM